MKKVLLSLFIVACVFVVTGCGSKKSASMTTGTYKLVEMKQGETKISADLLKAAGVEYTLTIKDGNKAVLDMGTEKENLEYNDKYFYPSDDKDQKASYTYKDGKITIEADSTSMTFEK